MTRTFVAVPIPAEWHGYLADLSRDLATRGSGLSWVKPDNFHFTMRFLGDLGESGVRRVCEATLRAAGKVAPIPARLGGLGAFPTPKRPRVVWVGLAEGGEALSEAARSIAEALARAGFGPPDKPFRPHLTLARVREGARGVDTILATPLPPDPGPAALDRILVMKSDLHPSGSRYTALTEARLRPPEG